MDNKVSLALMLGLWLAVLMAMMSAELKVSMKAQSLELMLVVLETKLVV